MCYSKIKQLTIVLTILMNNTCIIAKTNYKILIYQKIVYQRTLFRIVIKPKLVPIEVNVD